MYTFIYIYFCPTGRSALSGSVLGRSALSGSVLGGSAGVGAGPSAAEDNDEQSSTSSPALERPPIGMQVNGTRYDFI